MRTPMVPTRADPTLCRANWWGERCGRASSESATERVVIVHVGPAGPVEVAQHRRAEPGSPAIDNGPVPPAPDGALHREPLPGTAAKTAFLASVRAQCCG